MAVEMGHKLGLSLTGIGGVDILNKNTKLVLAFVWQVRAAAHARVARRPPMPRPRPRPRARAYTAHTPLSSCNELDPHVCPHLARPGVALLRSHSLQLMRLQLLSKLKDVGGGKVPKDADIIDWANATVAAAGAEQTISSFKDSSIGSGCVHARDGVSRPCLGHTAVGAPRAARPRPLPPSPPPPAEAPCLVVFPACSTFLLALLSAVEPRAINPSLVTPGESEEERRQNAK